MSSVPKAVPSAVPRSTGNSVSILKRPQLGPYQPMSGHSVVPAVGKTGVDGEPSPQPHFTGGVGKAAVDYEGASAPSVPRDGFLFRAPPIDEHYQSEVQPHGNPYGTVGRPTTLGWWTRVQSYINGIATSQDVDNAGWKERHPQQRTSVRLNALPPRGLFGTQTFNPTPQPQATRFNRITPVTGTDPAGSGRPTSMGGILAGRVLNSDTFGAGQTAGGVGGNNYTPTPGPPDQNSTAGTSGTSAMPTWG